MKAFKADWNNPTDYPRIGCIDSERLAWEFIRRNDDYAKEVEGMARFLANEEFYKGIKKDSLSVLDGVVCYPEAKPGETAQEFHKRINQEKIKRWRIEKPANTFANKWGLKKPVSPDTNYDSKLVVFEKAHLKLKRTEDFKFKTITLTLHPNEITARFRLDLPIPKQIKHVTQMLMLEAHAYDERLKKLTDDEKKEYVSLANTEHTQTIFQNAGFWLRSFDASKERSEPTNNSDAKRELDNGNGLKRKTFNKEISLENVDLPTESQFKKLSLSMVKRFQKLAEDYIQGRKFQNLLYGESRILRKKKTVKNK